MSISYPEPPFFSTFDLAQVSIVLRVNLEQNDVFLARELPGHFWGPFGASLEDAGVP